jgi:hypothetical protein
MALAVQHHLMPLNLSISMLISILTYKYAYLQASLSTSQLTYKSAYLQVSLPISPQASPQASSQVRYKDHIGKGIKSRQAERLYVGHIQVITGCT